MRLGTLRPVSSAFSSISPATRPDTSPVADEEITGMRRTVMTLAGVRRRQDGPYWRDTLDYVFVSPGVAVRECRAIFDKHAPGDATLFASDHLGLMAAFELNQVEQMEQIS